MGEPRIGLIARAENRGLGVLCWEFARHLHPDVLAVDVHVGTDGYAVHHDRYPGATRVRWRGRLPEVPVRRWLERVTTVYSAETFYDPSFSAWAREAGVATVLHTMPEFHRDLDAPSEWWAPTSWRLNYLPACTRVVPVPVAHSRWPPQPRNGGPCRWVHVAGKRALADRNGTDIVCAALPYLREPCMLTIVRQDPNVRISLRDRRSRVDARVVDGTAEYWQLYAEADALVLPRRYGGLSLPCQEAMGAGLAVLMPDCPPNPQTWPVATVRAREGETHRMPAGVIEAVRVDPVELAAEMDRFADPAYRAGHQDAARAWADAHSWERWTDRYRALLAEVGA